MRRGPRSIFARSIFARSIFERSTFAPPIFALSNFALSNFALSNFALSNFALSNFALSNFALSNFALSNFALSNFALSNFALPILACACLLGACEPEPEPEPPGEPVEEPSEALRLEVPPELIHEARREATGLYRLPRTLRAQTLAERRGEPAPSYAELRADADGHARERVSFTGRVGLVRSAGPRLWIMALHTRRDGDGWADPLYVLSTIPPLIEPEGGVVATIDGWVVGERTIGRHALPLIVAYYVERPEPPEEP